MTFRRTLVDLLLCGSLCAPLASGCAVSMRAGAAVGPATPAEPRPYAAAPAPRPAPAPVYVATPAPAPAYVATPAPPASPPPAATPAPVAPPPAHGGHVPPGQIRSAEVHERNAARKAAHDAQKGDGDGHGHGHGKAKGKKK
jgi:hypothetical protein